MGGRKVKMENNPSKRKKYIFKGLIIAVYTICICLIAIFSTILIQNKMNESSEAPGDVASFKQERYINETFDRFVAFGGYGVSGKVYIDVLCKSNLITEEDRIILLEYKAAHSGSWMYFNIYMGVKNGKDVIELHHIYDPWETLTFESKLSYPLESIITEFEELSGVKLTKEFLNGSVPDSMFRQTLGILVDFKYTENNTYEIYYRTTINGEVYAIDK